MLEAAWQFRAHDPDRPLGHPGHRSNLPQLPDFWLDLIRDSAVPFIVPPPGAQGTVETTLAPALVLGQKNVLWDHLIYAYMIENTRIYEIFRRILHEFLHGEKLGVPTPAAQHWLRNTEELFYRDPPSFSITTITSHIRSDLGALRRHAYHRMFAMDLNHGTDEGQPYPYFKADAANNEFVTTFEEFLREAWVAISNRHNTSGTNPTDQGKIENLLANLQNMLMSRRANGNLSREEFVFVSMMSWFHLTVEFDSPIIQALRAEATGREQRLFKVAQRVGLPAHGLSKSYFDIADPISRVLIDVEASGTAIVPDIVATAAPPTPPNAIQVALNTIITHWSIITGRDVKARKVTTT
ncbi:MAG TPA: hypothetical protein PK614_04970 [Nitrospira sp.]|nr:hypothetical protein [Nitrospira sp.]